MNYIHNSNHNITRVPQIHRGTLCIEDFKKGMRKAVLADGFFL